MKVNLPIIGQVRTGIDAVPEVKVVEKQVTKALNDVLGSVLDSSSRLSDEKKISTKLLEANKEWVYRNNDVIAKEVANLDFLLYRVKLVNDNIEYEEIKEHPLLDLLDRFNDTTTKSDALYVTQSHKKLTGDCFWLLEGSGSEINNIFLLPPDKMEIDIGDPTDNTTTLVNGYKYTDVIDGKRLEREYEPEEILHFKTPNPNNQFRGYGAVEALAQTIDLDNLSSEVMLKFFQNGAIVNFLLTTEGKLNPEQIKRLRAELQAAYGGISKAFKTMILGNGLKAEKLSMSNKEMEMIAQLEWYRDKIMVGFGNTKASIGIIDDVNRASHESSIIAWKRNSVKPEMEAIVNTLNEFLAPRYGEDLILGFEDPIPEDREAKLLEMKEMVGLDIITPNEARELLGYDAREEEVNDQLRREQPQLPVGLESVDVKRVLRKRGLYVRQAASIQLKSLARPLAEKIIKSRKKEATKEHTQFTDDQVWGYWQKQIHIVETVEERFDNALKQYIKNLEAIAIDRVDDEVNSKKTITKALYTEEPLLTKAELDFTPILMEQVIASGQQAYNLIGLDQPYIPLNIREAVRLNVRKFAKSMIDTDQDKLAKIIADGIANGDSIPKIKNHITEAFEVISKNQSKVITRTEVIKASNMSAIDAWDQSGVVEAKQWLTAEDDRVDSMLCAPMNGKIIGLKDKFFKKGEEFNGYTFNYSSIKEPPLHPMCRCVLLPVLVSQKAYEPVPIAERELMTKKIEELEASIDKRTRSYKLIKEQSLDDKAYIKALESHLGVNDDG